MTDWAYIPLMKAEVKDRYVLSAYDADSQVKIMAIIPLLEGMRNGRVLSK